jgi:putative ABC transport system substrate-binding protein
MTRQGHKMKKQGSHLWSTILICCGLASMPLLAWGDIFIVLSHDAAPYREVQAGFQAAVVAQSKSENFAVEVVEDEWRVGAALQKMKALAPRLILTLGAKATRSILAHEHDIPVIASLIVNDEPLQQAANATAVTLEFPAALQWRWLRQVLPGANRVGVLYSPQENEALFQALVRLAKSESVELQALPAGSPEALPKLFERLPNDLDAVWPLGSTQLFVPASVRELLLYSFRNRLPLIGLSTSWVEAGALYALERDYPDLGRQCAELALQILGGDKTAARPAAQSPRSVSLAINLKTAAHMKLNISESLVRDAREVFR